VSKKPHPRAARRGLPFDPLFRQVRKDAWKFFLGARGSHDWDHTERVLRLCLRIGKKERADLEILMLSAVLHDIGRAEEDKSRGRISHAEAGASAARKILEARGVEPEKIERIIHGIKAHRFRKRGNAPATPEAKILFDADKLDSLGAVGVGRAFLFAGEVGARLHNPDTDISKTRPYTKEDTAYREFMVKLRRLKDRIHTREGKRIAAERHRFMVAFFDRLNKESQGKL